MTKENMQDIFTRLYGTRWNNDSGPGSTPEYTAAFRDFLKDFIINNRVKSVLDIGCGDWQFAKLMDWTGIRYTGIDVVQSVIDANRKNHVASNIDFECCDVTSSILPDYVDLMLLKDVMQHWSNKTILEFIPRLKGAKFVVISNCYPYEEAWKDVTPSMRAGIHPVQQSIGVDTPNGGFRTLDLGSDPFNLPVVNVLSFKTKIVQVLSGRWI